MISRSLHYTLLLQIAIRGDSLVDFVYTAFYVFCGELVVDWVKHVFITKFNSMSDEVYSSFSMILSQDVTAYRYERASMDPTHTVNSRIGIAMIPLACLVIRVVLTSVQESSHFNLFQLSGILLALEIYLILIGSKIVINILLHGVAAIQMDPLLLLSSAEPGSDLARSRGSSTATGSTVGKEEQSKLAILSSVKRFTLWKSRIP
jgi:hypothetical protein